MSALKVPRGGVIREPSALNTAVSGKGRSPDAGIPRSCRWDLPTTVIDVPVSGSIGKWDDPYLCLTLIWTGVGDSVGSVPSRRQSTRRQSDRVSV